MIRSAKRCAYVLLGVLTVFGLNAIAQIGGGGVGGVPTVFGSNLTFNGTTDHNAAATFDALAEFNSTAQFDNTVTFSSGGSVNINTNVATIDGVSAQVQLNENDAAVDNRRWQIKATGEQFIVSTINDAQSVTGSALTIDRTGTTVDTVNFLGTTVSVNGDEIHDAGNLEFAFVRANSSGTILADQNVTSITDGAGLGNWTLNFDSNTFTGTPSCTCTTDSAGECTIGASTSSSAFQLNTRDSAGALADRGFHTICMFSGGLVN